MLKKLFFSALLLVGVLSADAQYVVNKWRVNFTDKNNSPYSIGSPSAYLSPKAIARRSAQGIPIVQNDIPVNSWYVDSVRNTGVTILNVSKWFNSVTILTIDTSKIAQILAFPFVQSVDSLADTPVKKGAKRIYKNRDTMKEGDQVGFELTSDVFPELLMMPSCVSVQTYDYGQGYTQIHMLATDYLHDLGYRGQGMTIAILDAGFYNVNSLPIFDSLFANNQVLGTKDFVNPGGSVYAVGTHGMSVLSTMGGNLPGELIGTAPKANYYLLRTEDGATEFPIEEDNWVCGAEYADSVGADVINSSLGYTNFDNTNWSHTYADMDGEHCRSSRGAAIAASKGILVVNSAGNSGNDPWNYIGAPADADSILTVGAVDEYGIYAYFSSNGPSYDLRVKPNVCAMGLGTFVANSTGGVQAGNGTSFSSPVMAGSATCLWQANPGMNNLQIINVLQQSADHYLNPDTLYGYGIPNLAAAHLILGGKQIHNFDLESNINVSPNPFTDHFSIVFYSTKNTILSIELFDAGGKSVFKQDSVVRDIGYNYIPVRNLEHIPAGVYILKVVSGEAVFTNKMMKTEH